MNYIIYSVLFVIAFFIGIVIGRKSFDKPKETGVIFINRQDEMYMQLNDDESLNQMKQSDYVIMKIVKT